MQKRETRGPIAGPEPGKDLPVNVVSIRQLPSYPGIYAINSALGPYVGQSRSLKRRLKEHLKRLSEGAHHNDNLQMIFKERPAELSARVLEYAPSGLWGKRIEIWLDRREAFWMHRYGNALNIEPPKAEPFDEDKHGLEKHKIKQKIGVLKSEIKEKEKKLALSKINRERKLRELGEKIAELEIRYNQLSEKRSFISKIFGPEDDELKEVSKKLEDWRLEKSIYACAYTHESPEQLETEIQSINRQIVHCERMARLLEAEEQIFRKPE